MTAMATTDARTISDNLHRAMGIDVEPRCRSACTHVVSGTWTIGGMANVLARSQTEPRISPADAVAVLNRIHDADGDVMPALISMRVTCNEAVRDDPTVQVGAFRADGTQVGTGAALANTPEPAFPDHYEVGFLGVLNGIFGIRDDGKGYIGAQYTDVGKRLVEFTVNDGS